MCSPRAHNSPGYIFFLEAGQKNSFRAFVRSSVRNTWSSTQIPRIGSIKRCTFERDCVARHSLSNYLCFTSFFLRMVIIYNFFFIVGEQIIKLQLRIGWADVYLPAGPFQPYLSDLIVNANSSTNYLRFTSFFLRMIKILFFFVDVGEQEINSQLGIGRNDFHLPAGPSQPNLSDPVDLPHGRSYIREVRARKIKSTLL